MLLRMSLKRFNWRGKSHLSCGQHCSMGRSPKLSKLGGEVKRRKRTEYQHLSLLSVNTVCRDTSCSCCCACLPWWTGPANCEPVNHLQLLLSGALSQRKSVIDLPQLRWPGSLCRRHPACCCLQCNTAAQGWKSSCHPFSARDSYQWVLQWQPFEARGCASAKLKLGKRLKGSPWALSPHGLDGCRVFL